MPVAERKPPSRTAIRALDEDSGLYYSRPGAARSSFGFVNAYSPGETTPLKEDTQALELARYAGTPSPADSRLSRERCGCQFPFTPRIESRLTKVGDSQVRQHSVLLNLKLAHGDLIALLWCAGRKCRGDSPSPDTSATVRPGPGQIYNARAATRKSVGLLYVRALDEVVSNLRFARQLNRWLALDSGSDPPSILSHGDPTA
ncbi:hypothetical protein DFH07DRAFT_779715 [Mycena maculata]|uniref:Uncharacterized protein n=1 Tax=Mycena maculata TaxID=230809 RepID=A0AAD7MX14_9AGAR|nr:hypothetical protein DFH07DRAFT_779715 [Mycena maculata]